MREDATAVPLTASTRAGRQARIIALLATHEVRSQPQLASLLAAEGIDTTQATLSRDLEELGAVKLRAPTAVSGCTSCPRTAARFAESPVEPTAC